uniref:BPM/SPOP BACK domain-containing protein n=1 Tax=Oryza glaberrima TaxID=4538 RepID=I1QUT3_ORYGL
MAQHLLAVADKYGLHRLKMICLEILSSHIDANSVATILVLAEKHYCYGLKEACFEFLNSAVLSAIAARGKESVGATADAGVRGHAENMQVARDQGTLLIND